MQRLQALVYLMILKVISCHRMQEGQSRAMQSAYAKGRLVTEPGTTY